MYQVDDETYDVQLLPLGPVSTTVWLSKRAADELTDFIDRDKTTGARFLKKLKEWAKAGFANFEGGDGFPIKHEGDGVFRVGMRSSLFRLLGFYNNGKGEFIVIDAVLKRGLPLSSSDRKRITEVARVKRVGCWRRILK